MRGNNDQEVNQLSNIFVGMMIHYLLYESKATKSYATITSSNTNDIERRISYMIKTMLKKIIDANPLIASSVSRISMRYGHISVFLNHFGGNMWGRANDISNRISRGYLIWAMPNKFFPEVEEDAFPVKVDHNGNSISFVMGKNFYNSDADISWSRNDLDDISTPEIRTPLKAKVRLLHGAITSIPTIFQDIIIHREELRSRMFNAESGNEISTTFRYTISDMYFGFIKSGSAAYMLRNTSSIVIYYQEINILLNDLFNFGIRDNTYPTDNAFLNDCIEVMNSSRYASNAERIGRAWELILWLRSLCESNEIEYISVNPSPPITDSTVEATLQTLTITPTVTHITPPITPIELDEETIAERASNPEVLAQLRRDLEVYFSAATVAA